MASLEYMSSAMKLHLEAAAVGDIKNIANDTFAERTAFERLMAEWRAVTSAIRLNDAETPEDNARFHSDLATQLSLTRQITNRPTNDVVNVMQKLEVLEKTLNDGYDSGLHNDHRELMMLGCIRADLMRMEFGPLDN